VKTEQRTFKIPNKTTTLTVSTISSAYHIEMNPSECGHQDRVVVQEIIKEIAQSKPLETAKTAQKPFKGIHCCISTHLLCFSFVIVLSFLFFSFYFYFFLFLSISFYFFLFLFFFLFFLFYLIHCVVVVLNQVGDLTHEAQAGLRRTMEKYMTTCRLILCTNALTKVRCIGTFFFFSSFPFSIFALIVSFQVSFSSS
jgi:DNA polymerase III delta prime subunit